MNELRSELSFYRLTSVNLQRIFFNSLADSGCYLRLLQSYVKYYPAHSYVATSLQVADTRLLHFKLHLTGWMIRGNMFLKSFNAVRPTTAVDTAEDADELRRRRVMMCQVAAVGGQCAGTGTTMLACEHSTRRNMPRSSWLIVALIHVNLYKQQQHHKYITVYK